MKINCLLIESSRILHLLKKHSHIHIHTYERFFNHQTIEFTREKIIVYNILIPKIIIIIMSLHLFRRRRMI